MIGFVAWLAKVDIDREFNAYHIFFEGSVTGLSSASNVLYRGIPVGTVNEVIIDPDDSSRVRVTVEVASNTPIREDSVATLELQGITGASLIQITGGSADSPELVAKSDQTLPVIRSKPSSFQQLFAGAPRTPDPAGGPDLPGGGPLERGQPPLGEDDPRRCQRGQWRIGEKI